MRRVIPLLVLCNALSFHASAGPYSTDADTLLLEHLDGSTTGSLQGTANFASGLAALGQCANIPAGGFVMYASALPSAGSGTIECWVNPSQWPCGMMCYNLNYTTSQPPGGYVMHLTLNANGTVHYYSVGNNLDGATPLPTNAWSHVAVTWSSGGTTIYLNGVADGHSAGNFGSSGGYLYLNNSWGIVPVGRVDEMRISRTARSAAALRDHYIANSGRYHRLDVTIQGAGSVAPTNGWYEADTNLNLTATPAADWLFVGWSGSLLAGYSATNTTLTLDADKQIIATFSDDADGDALLNTTEWSLGTDPRNRDSDGDGFDDGFEVQHNYLPLVSDAALTDYIRAHNAAFNLYPSNAVLDVAVGQVLLNVTSGSARLNLQLQQRDSLDGSWTNAGTGVEWSVPVSDAKQFFRVRSAP